ncbi:uncharacterized protein B0H18DRAFT_992199 [Fomitopsis serialis]|uniref:uncharacterized protein n=1 Tax=Fomitopsis serialis TaxID=139415 RepID=UPI0020074508|nr:uncharacterized protein B0H18DRAFT_992199 [Neoantrodia serialis]KAH9931000.1 hypothetical protein B0H18DRAFT_992199 [Neoantrodia serialis]
MPAQCTSYYIEPSSSIRKSSAPISVLPPDVLLMIFRAVLDVESDSTIMASFAADWDEPDPCLPRSDPNFRWPFQESLTSVCCLWRELMASVSTFWTCLVIWIDEEPPQLARIRDYVTWSRDRLIDIYILRRDALRPHTKGDPTEKAHVKAVMDVLSPHMKRWQTLRVRLLHSSSLPLPRVDLVGCADELILLRLSSVIDDTVASIEAAPSLDGEFHAPKLLWLYMGGFPFREVYVKPFPRLPLPPRLDGVYLLEYDSHHPPFPLVDLLSCLASCNGLYKVQLANLKLDCSYTGPPILESTMTWDVIDFIDMTGNIISEYNRLLDYSYAEMASYTRCSMDTPAQLGDSYVISMEGIVNAMALFSLLAGAQGQESCRRAWFISCDGLCSEIIRALAMPIPTPLGEFWVCRYLKGLTIVGCTQFRSSDLRSLFEARRDAHAATGFVEDDEPGHLVSTVNFLHVRDCCELAPEDKEWFHRYVATVRWDDWRGGYNNPS